MTAGEYLLSLLCWDGKILPLPPRMRFDSFEFTWVSCLSACMPVVFPPLKAWEDLELPPTELRRIWLASLKFRTLLCFAFFCFTLNDDISEVSLTTDWAKLEYKLRLTGVVPLDP